MNNIKKIIENIVCILGISVFITFLLIIILDTTQNPFLYLVGSIILITILRFTVNNPKMWKILNKIFLFVSSFLFAAIILLFLGASNFYWYLLCVLVVLITMKHTIKSPEIWKKIFMVWLPLAIFSFIFVTCLVGMLFAYPNQIGLSYWSIVLTVISLGIVFAFDRYLLKDKRTWYKYVLWGMFLYIIVSLSAFFGEERGFFKHSSSILSTPDAQKAEKIVSDLKLNHLSRVEYKGDQKFYIIPTNDQFDEYVLFIVNKYAFDKDVFIPINSKYFPSANEWRKNPHKIQKVYEKYYNKLVLQIKGISSSDIYFEIFAEDNSKLIINIDVFDGYDMQKIYKIVDKLFECYEERKINIKVVPQLPSSLFFVYRERMDEFYNKQHYDEVLKLIKELQNKLPKDDSHQDFLTLSYECINQKMYWTKKIGQNPHKAEYYVKRGDISKKSGQICYDGYEYNERVSDYKKALEINPKLYYLYEELGDAIPYYLPYPVIEEQDEKNLYKKLEYYQKALEGDNKNYYLQLKIAAVYEELNNFEKALKIYENIPDKKMSTLEKRIPERFGRENNWFYRGNNDVYSDIYRCYWILGQYNKARKVAISRLEIETNNAAEKIIRQEIYNKVFDLDLKMKNYKQAKQDAQNCSKFLCKLIKKLP